MNCTVCDQDLPPLIGIVDRDSDTTHYRCDDCSIIYVFVSENIVSWQVMIGNPAGLHMDGIAADCPDPDGIMIYLTDGKTAHNEPFRMPDQALMDLFRKYQLLV